MVRMYKRRRPRGLSLDESVVWYLEEADTDENGCLIPTLKPGRDGYVHFAFDGGFVILHREVLKIKLGRDIRDGMQTSHLCHNRPCCNPDHIVEATVSENHMQSAVDGRAYRGECNPKAVLTENDVREIRKRRANGERPSALGREFGVVHSAIIHACQRVTWKHVA